MWLAITPEKFEKFPNLKSVLSYLQMCVHSVIVDYVRGREQAILMDQEDLVRIPDSKTPSVERRVSRQVDGEALWQWLAGRLKNEQERQVVYGSFILAMKPRELYAHFSESFKSVKDVYRVKENVMARLRRDDALQKLLKTGTFDAGESASPSVYDG
jgi:DNA-directed RNA polymerase specialized sigma24 family protein